MLKFGNKSDTGGGLKQPTAHQFFNLFIKLNPVMGVGGPFEKFKSNILIDLKQFLLPPMLDH